MAGFGVSPLAIPYGLQKSWLSGNLNAWSDIVFCYDRLD
jgi:hypothetical protein